MQRLDAKSRFLLLDVFASISDAPSSLPTANARLDVLRGAMTGASDALILGALLIVFGVLLLHAAALSSEDIDWTWLLSDHDDAAECAT